jgi:ribonuclease P protein component
MLPKKNRLSRKEINLLREKKIPILQGQFFGLMASFLPGEKRVGVIISAKISKKAVVRNELKRRLFRALGEVDWPGSGWYLFLAKKKALLASQEEIKKELVWLGEKVRSKK